MAYIYYVFGMLLNVIVAAISLFHRRINGDYKYFIFNEAFASFALALCHFQGEINLLITGSPNLMYLSNGSTFEVVLICIINNINTELQAIGSFMPMLSLMLTLMNRLMLLSPMLNPHYDRFMSKRLCVLYCVVFNLVTFLTDSRLIIGLIGAPYSYYFMIICVYFLAPWLCSIFLAVALYRSVRSQMKSVANVGNDSHLKDNRSILFSMIVQISVPILANFPPYFQLLVTFLPSSAQIAVYTSVVFPVIEWLVQFNLKFSTLYPPIIILTTMKPYRDVWRFWNFTKAKRFFCKQSKSDRTVTVVRPFTVSV
jgi:hypothetical protein